MLSCDPGVQVPQYPFLDCRCKGIPRPEAFGADPARRTKSADEMKPLREQAEAERQSFTKLCEATERLHQRADALRESVERFRL